MPSAEAAHTEQLAARVAFGIVTALDEEYAAVLAMLENPVPYVAAGKGAGLRYYLGEIPAPDGRTHVVALALAVGMGNNIAAVRGTLLLQHFKQIEAILMVGIAGGVPWPERPDDHVRLGDIVLSDERGVVQFDFVKKTRTYVERQHPRRPPCARLFESAKYLSAGALAGQHPWEAHIRRADHLANAARPPADTDVLVSTARPEEVLAHPADPARREGMPRVMQGAIASSGTLLMDSRVRDRLRGELGVRAVEMEGSGIADATWNHGVGFLVIRGICDYCDDNKNYLWHGYAAVVAAAYARALLETTPSQARKPAAKKKPPPAKPKAKVPHNLPPQRTFVGREEHLLALEDALSRDPLATVAQGQASVYGLGGVGKTALALEYAWRNLSAYPGGVYWVDAEGPPQEAMAKLGVRLRAEGSASVRQILAELPRNAPTLQLATAARAALQNQDEAILLILDNVNADGFRDYIPASPVTVLMTTRDERLALGTATLLDVLSDVDATKMADALAGTARRSAETEARDRVVIKELGALAVAVEMAALSVRGWAESWRDYERELRVRAKELMATREPHSGYPFHVMAALDLSLERCEDEPDAQRLLQGMAVFAPDGVPTEWAEAAATFDSERDSVTLKRARATLKGLGLVRVDTNRKTLSMHRLIHARVRDRIHESKPEPWWTRVLPWFEPAKGAEAREQAWIEACKRGAECVADCLQATVGPERERRAEVEALWPHIQAALEAAELARAEQHWLVIALQMAGHLMHCVRYSEAQALFEEALKKAESLHPPDVDFALACLSGLSSAFQNMLHLDKAETFARRALDLSEKAHGLNDPRGLVYMTNLSHILCGMHRDADARPFLERALVTAEEHSVEPSLTANILYGLAVTFRKLGKLQDSLSLFERALVLSEASHGVDSPSNTEVMAWLATTQSDLGLTQQARFLFERALRIDETTYGPVHPNVARRLWNLAGQLVILGESRKARLMLERSLAIFEAIGQSESRQFAGCLESLSGALKDLGLYTDAGEALERALSIYEEKFGPDYPDVAGALVALGSLLEVEGKPVEARSMLERALSILEKGGQETRRVAQCKATLASVLTGLGHAADALPLIEHSLEMSEKLFGPDNPSVGSCCRTLGIVLKELGRATEARLTLERSLTIAETAYGPGSDIVANCLSDLATFLEEQNQAADARPLLERALVIYETTYGSEHPEFATCLSKLAGVRAQLGQAADARPMLERALALHERIYEASHPRIAMDLSRLGGALHSLGQPEDAKPLLERAVSLQETLHGPSHSATIRTRARLAAVLRNLEVQATEETAAEARKPG